MFDPDPENPIPPAEDERSRGKGLFPLGDGPGKLDLVELAEKFSVHGGGQVSAQVSADLALDLVLNEIAEQACLATPASGAAIVLAREGEWVCRASAGGNSPSLGARLDAEAGLSGACIKTRQVQRCDDAQSDPRVDAEACRSLGLRSVIILPLLQDDELVGVFEAFSSYPAAFGGRDESTLEVLSQRVLTILKQTHNQPLHTSMERADNSLLGNSGLDYSGVGDSGAENLIVENFAGDSAAAKDASGQDASGQSEDPALSEGTRVATGRGIAALTWILGAAVLAFALLLTVLIGERLFRGRTASRTHPPTAVSSTLSNAEHNSATVAGGTTEAGANGAPVTKTESAKPSDNPTSSSASTAPGTRTSHAAYPPPPVGGLLVLEKGKEIFRMPAAAEEGDRRNLLGTNRTGFAGTAETSDRPASGVEQASIYELSPEAASGSLLHRVEPDYPQESLQRHIQGPVVLDVRIARNGTTQEVKLVAGERLLADAAIAAVKQWQFKPHLIKGQPVEMQTRVTLNFRLPR